ncbi:MAG: response regulator [Bacteroidaceae bacterium]|nr:response regulator [Bacteroidaceae bacterium]
MEKYGTLLAVDDNPAILTAVKICLGNVFNKVVTLSDPERILPTLAQEGEVDAVLLDMNFTLGLNSGQDGLLWLRAILKRHPGLPVVLITAYADIQLAVKGLKAGAADFLTKPWDNDDLIRVLKDAIDKARHVDSLEDVTSHHVQRVVEQCHGNMSEAARLLGITRQTLYARLRKP